MSLVAVEASPTLRLVSKAAEVDPGGTHELLRLALYETLCDQVDAARPYLERDLEEYVTKRDAAIRRAVVRQFIDARIAGEPVEEIAKAGPATDNDRKHGWFRDVLGRFASHSNDFAAGANTATGALQAYSTQRDVDAKDDNPFNKPRYQSMKATGALLSSFDNPHTNAVGAAATAVGSLGPEAEKVLGNGIRRTAYRYRGTERMPSRELKRDIKSGLAFANANPEQQAAFLESYRGESTRAQALAGKPFDKDRSTARRRESVSNSVEIGDFWRKRGAKGDKLEMNVAGDLAANYYIDKLPSPEHTAISIAAGAVPPSQGVIIDADGDVVSEAMGFNGDHYVPFDLKNLRSLQGGQYVRTRAVGGPTTEDIYTGLLSGARQVQVVSNSGVFTLEFDPSVRGGRRYSDKARQMVSRYEHLLDAIDQSDKSGLYQVDITPKERRDIQQKYAADYTGDDLKTLVDRDVERLRTEKSFKMLTDEEVDAKARELLRQEKEPPRGRLQELRNEVREKSRAESVKRFQLDGDGYEAALKALKQEFPYFIRDAYREKLPDFLNSRDLRGAAKFSSATDQGYVSPKTRATGLARSITTDTKHGVVRQGFHEPPLRHGEKPPAGDRNTDGGGEGDSTAGDTPSRSKITDPLRLPAVNRRVGSYAANLKVLANSQGFRPGEQAVLTPEEWPSQPAGRVLFEANLAGSAHKAGMGGYLADLPPEARAAYADALREVPGMLDDLQLSPRDKQAYADSANHLLDLIDLSLPLATGHPDTYSPEQSGRPLHFSDMPSPMAGTEELEEYIKHLRVDERATLDYLDAFQDDDDAVSTISALLDAHDSARDPQDKAQAKVNLEGAQRAFALMRLRHQAATLEAITGSPGKAPASPERAEADFKKRQTKKLTWHPPGSPVATEFQKFLARR